MDDVSGATAKEPTADLNCALTGCRPHHRHHFPPPPFLKWETTTDWVKYNNLGSSPTALGENSTVLSTTRTRRLIRRSSCWMTGARSRETTSSTISTIMRRRYTNGPRKSTPGSSTRSRPSLTAITRFYPSFIRINENLKVHDILANKDLTPRQIWEKLVALKLDPVVARSLRAVYFFVVHQKSKGMEDFQVI